MTDTLIINCEEEEDCNAMFFVTDNDPFEIQISVSDTMSIASVVCGEEQLRHLRDWIDRALEERR